jgi:hypothetical protein
MSQDQRPPEKVEKIVERPKVPETAVVEVKAIVPEVVERTVAPVTEVKVTPPRSNDRTDTRPDKQSEAHKRPDRNDQTKHHHRPEIKKVDTRTVFLKPVPPSAVTKPDVKADLKNALASVLQNTTKESVTPAPAPAPQSAQKEPVPVQSAIGPARRATPQFGQSNNDLDPNVIRRMLRDEKQDRSPFA